MASHKKTRTVNQWFGHKRNNTGTTLGLSTHRISQVLGFWGTRRKTETDAIITVSINIYNWENLSAIYSQTLLCPTLKFGICTYCTWVVEWVPTPFPLMVKISFWVAITIFNQHCKINFIIPLLLFMPEEEKYLCTLKKPFLLFIIFLCWKLPKSKLNLFFFFTNL